MYFFWYFLFILLSCFLCFFFFKQNTAYEMRISDWSSDVCSSDLTASHNPAEYNGFKIKAAYVGPATPSIIDGVESRIPDHVSLELRTLEEYRSEGLIETVDLETLYCEHIEENFDWNSFQESGLGLA